MEDAVLISSCFRWAPYQCVLTLLRVIQQIPVRHWSSPGFVRLSHLPTPTVIGSSLKPLVTSALSKYSHAFSFTQIGEGVRWEERVHGGGGAGKSVWVSCRTLASIGGMKLRTWKHVDVTVPPYRRCPLHHRTGDGEPVAAFSLKKFLTSGVIDLWPSGLLLGCAEAK